MSEQGFDLWLEIEQCDPAGAGDPEDDFCNIQFRLGDGRAYALNVWTFKFLERVRRGDAETGEGLSGKYLIPPDLFVEKLERGTLTEIVADLIRAHELKEEWLVREPEEGQET